MSIWKKGSEKIPRARRKTSQFFFHLKAAVLSDPTGTLIKDVHFRDAYIRDALKLILFFPK